MDCLIGLEESVTGVTLKWCLVCRVQSIIGRQLVGIVMWGCDQLPIGLQGIGGEGVTRVEMLTNWIVKNFAGFVLLGFCVNFGRKGVTGREVRSRVLPSGDTNCHDDSIRCCGCTYRSSENRSCCYC